MTSSPKRTRKDGVSLAKGPVGLLGLAMLAFGVLSFLLGDSSLTSSPVDGAVEGDTFLGVEGNGWTNLLWIAGGALLAFGAPFHWGAKTMAMVVGLALGAASVIAMFDGDAVFADGDVLGIFATNDWTIALLGLASAYLLVSSLLPKVGRRDRAEHHEPARASAAEHEAVRDRARTAPIGGPTAGRERDLHDDHDRDALREDRSRVVEPRADEGRFGREGEGDALADDGHPGREHQARTDDGHLGREREPLADPQAQASRDAEGRRP